MKPDHRKHIESLVNAIRGQRSVLDALAQQLRTPDIRNNFDKWNERSWCISVAGDSLVRIRLLTEQNFNIVETMGVVGVARYMFEAALWLRLFALDSRYGLVYFNQLLLTQKRFHEDTINQLQREAQWLKALGRRESSSRDDLLRNLKPAGTGATDGQKLLQGLSAASARIDAEAARRFSIYAEAARTNGYDFQAHLVETKALPAARESVAGIAAELDQFESMVAGQIKDIRPRRWQWRQMAQKVDQVNEYDYLYSFASKLLHATPVSITTNQKNLEAPEMELFLKYIKVTIGDVLSLAGAYRSAAAVG